MTLPANWREPAHIDVRTVFATGFPDVDAILQRRGFTDTDAARAWLNPDLEALAKSLHIPGLDEVIVRILRAIESGERILIFGDYDCDGITSTAILYSALCFAARDHRSVGWMLPSRDDGYGLREVQLDRVRTFKPDLLILVDCGSNDLETIAALIQDGIGVVVIDHHQISAQLPSSVPLANPQLDPAGDATIMTAAGLTWLTTFHLHRSGLTICRNGEGHRRYLDLAAIGTIADVASLTGINRAIVREGMQVLRDSRRHGFRALAREARIDLQQLRAEDVPFSLSTRLNSPGRIGSPDVVLRLILESNFDRATEQAREVLALDQQRKALGASIIDDAVALAEVRADERILVLTGDNWHPGVLGPVATKLAEQFGRPAVVMGGNGDVITGSGRSVPGWNIAQAFREVAEFVMHSGGHSGAAGLSVQREQLEHFRAAINAYEQIVSYDQPVEEIAIDAEIGAKGLPFGLVDAIEQLGPFGRGNPRPLFLWRDAHFMNLRFVGRNKSTAQLQIGNLQTSVGAVLFKQADRLGNPSSDRKFNVVLEPSISVWNGRSRVQARLVDFQPSD
jgi:single-stranded-DNA-specific exonuclease